MKILLANPRGFCAGVNMAIDVVDQVLALKGPPVYVFHEIVHNKHVVDDFRTRGVTFVDDISEVPPGGVVVYSAHGISPDVRRQSKERKLVEVDATCPLVTKVHLEVLRFARDGYHIIFIGHRKHDEAIGTVGEAPQHISVVESPEEAQTVRVPDPTKVAYVTQTTLSIFDANRIIAALKQRFPNIRSAPKEDICYATTNRQNAVSQLSREADLVLVIGSKNSSNSLRLVETAKELGRPAYLIDDQSELDPSWFEGIDCVMITAGASAPEHLVQAVLDRLRQDYGAQTELRTVVEEDVSFERPKSLRSLAVVG
ncbi:MAG TPA: 4-hydroxy-3-methylbut-2-enyl diphosphate reductase [Humisphaera sp.]|nr:4-hydroxy-3-methylbut-2-enyl diphosphate reductase [Humisphaera sp.]